MRLLYQFFTLLALTACVSDATEITDPAAANPGKTNDTEVNMSGGGQEETSTPVMSQVTEALSAPICSDNRVLYLWPDPNVIPFVQTAIDKYSLMGFNVAIDTSATSHGVRMYEVATVPGGQAYSYWKGSAPCFYDGCNSGNSHINVTTALLQRTDIGFINNSIQHEIGHLLSGFGGCVKPSMGLVMQDSMHLVSGHMVSNGNTGYANMTWTEQDTILLHSCL